MANYPTSYPTVANAGAQLSSNPHSTLHDSLRDEVLAIAQELGLSPSGSYATVKARLDDLGRHGCKVTRATTQSIPDATPTDVSFTTEVQDTDGFIAVTSGTVTIPSGLAGVYAITCSLVESGSISSHKIVAGGADYHFDSASHAIVVSLAVADTVHVTLEQSLGSPQDIDSAELQVWRVSL